MEAPMANAFFNYINDNLKQVGIVRFKFSLTKHERFKDWPVGRIIKKFCKKFNEKRKMDTGPFVIDTGERENDKIIFYMHRETPNFLVITITHAPVFDIGKPTSIETEPETFFNIKKATPTILEKRKGEFEFLVNEIMTIKSNVGELYLSS